MRQNRPSRSPRDEAASPLRLGWDKATTSHAIHVTARGAAGMTTTSMNGSELGYLWIDPLHADACD